MIVLSGRSARQLLAVLTEHRERERLRGRRPPGELIDLQVALTAEIRGWPDLTGQPVAATVAAPEPELVSALETARRLAVSERTVRRLAATEQLRPVRIGRAVRYRPEDIEDYVRRTHAHQ